MSEYSTLGDVAGKRVLVRSDLNVPLDGTSITDDGRIRASVPTIRALAEAGARVVVAAHLGRPQGAPEDRFSLAPVATRLGELLGASVAFATDTVGESAQATVGGLQDGQVALLENVRFSAGETSKDDAERGAFADQLAALADLFVSDGFGVVHRKQASVYDVAQRLPHAMGALVSTEIDVLRRLTVEPARPYVVVLGGSKVSDKLGVIDNLLGKADSWRPAGPTWRGPRSPACRSSFRGTSWWTPRSPAATTPRSLVWWPRTRSRPTASGSTSVRRRGRTSQPPWQRPGPSSGTVP